jgi:hypothetical protein
MRNLKIIVASILAIFVAIMVIQNREPVATHLLFATIVMPHAILLFITAAAGFALGALLTLGTWGRSGRWAQSGLRGAEEAAGGVLSKRSKRRLVVAGARRLPIDL